MIILLNLLALLNFISWLIDVYQIYAEVPGSLKYFNVVGNLVVACFCWYTAWILE